MTAQAKEEEREEREVEARSAGCSQQQERRERGALPGEHGRTRCVSILILA